METLTLHVVRERTAAWLERAEGTVACDDFAAGDDCSHALDFIRQGILLRRQWDRYDRTSLQRRQILEWLAAAQNRAHQRLACCVQERQGPLHALTGRTLADLEEDDAYLAGLLNDHVLPAETVAFAIECFRDDLHWLGTLVAVLDGAQGIDFLGRVLLEQEALQRTIDAWEGEIVAAAGPSSHVARQDASASLSGSVRSEESDDAADGHETLCRAAHRLRVAALTRRIESLMARSRPTEPRGWFRNWQSASRLAVRLDGECLVPVSSQRAAANHDRGAHKSDKFWALQTHEASQQLRRLQEYRAASAGGWRASLASAEQPDRNDLLARQVGELTDAVSDSLTFLEDLPLADAVRTLEVHAEDLDDARAALGDHNPATAAPLRKAVRRSRRSVEAELQERRLSLRMEQLLGRRMVAALERLILLLLLAFLVMLAVEGPLLHREFLRNEARVAAGLAPTHTVEAVFAWCDLAICAAFLSDFLLRFSLARGKWLYFRRNWLTGLVPAIPVGFLAYAAHHLLVAEATEFLILLRLLRYARLPQMGRWLMIARPVLRVMRLVAFSFRASDRLVRQLAPLLNRDLVLFERPGLRVERPAYQTGMAALRDRFHYRAPEVAAGLPLAARRRLVRARIDDLTAVLSAPLLGPVTTSGETEVVSARKIPVEDVIGWLLAATPAGISDRLSRNAAASVSRWCQAFDVLGVRRLPLVRDLVEAGRAANPHETTARVANRMGLFFQHWLDRVHWLADLYGTVTAPQLVDSLGEWMVKGSARPARRLLMFGAAFLVVSYLTSLMPFDSLNFLSGKLKEFIGAPLIVLGGLCLLPLFLGMWFRQIAGAATDFFTQVSEANGITVTKQLKQRLAHQHHALLHRRVIAPEVQLEESGDPRSAARRLAPDADASEGSGPVPCDRVEQARRSVERLWNDWLDSAPFHRTDTKTTAQLLGNLALLSIRETRLQNRRARRKRIQQLDLSATRGWLRGPYLWFHFIARSLAHQTARLVVDYNAHALPLERAQAAGDDDIRSYVYWLSRRWGVPVERLDLPPAFHARVLPQWIDQDTRSTGAYLHHGMQTGDFTAVHFFSNDPDLEADVRRRYGHAVADLMHRDRCSNIRRVFRTYPFHRWPEERRTFNPLHFYERHLAGGRMLLFPFKLAWWTLAGAWRLLRLLWQFIYEVLYPTVGEMDDLAEFDPLEVAVRKIHRMRMPAYVECLRMRAEFDPEYLGVLLPGCGALLRAGGGAPVEEDLARIGADPSLQREFRQLTTLRRRQMLELRRWLDEFCLIGQPAPSLRAMAIAYAIDHQNIRAYLEATRLLQRAWEDETRKPASLAAWWQPSGLWLRLRYRMRLTRLFRQGAFSGLDPAERRRFVWMLDRQRGPLLKAAACLTRAGAPENPADDARRNLSAIARDPATWTEQLVVLRTVQTLTVLDLWTYCDLVAELGEYPTHEPRTEDHLE